jgi:putative endopeptidase
MDFQERTVAVHIHLIAEAVASRTLEFDWRACALALALATAPLLAPAQGPASAPVPAATGRVHPGDDFHAYANDAWLSAPMPAGRDRWTANAEIAELAGRQLAALIEHATASPDGPDARRVADFRAAYLDTAAIESKGLAPVRRLLQRIEQVKTGHDLARLLGEWMLADVDPTGAGVFSSSHVLGLAVQHGLAGESAHQVFLLQGGLALPAREDYLDEAADKRSLRREYQAYVERLLAAGGTADAARRAQDVLRLETALAASHATRAQSQDEASAANRWRRADLLQRAPGLHWPALLAAAGLGRQAEFVIWQPSAVTGLAALVAEQPLRTWKDYLRYHVLHRHADVLPSAFAQASFPARAPATREERAQAATKAGLGEALSRLYIERHIPPASKQKVLAIAADVRAALRAQLAAATWMSPGTQARALNKLDGVYFGLGYPERWRDDTGPRIDRHDALGNVRRLQAHAYRQTLERIGRPVDRQRWWINAYHPGAVLTFELNAHNFAAGLLQLTKFDAEAPDAANYGAIGAIIGHELFHFIDTLGADFDENGAKRSWWTDTDRTAYRTLTEPLVRQFLAYRPLADIAVDGRASLTENLADLTGLAAAFVAHRAHLQAHTGQAEVREQDRQFFIAFARAWRGRYTERGLRRQAGAAHAPETYRVSTVRNIDAWYDAFDVRPGHRLYLDPADRVRLR